MTDWRDRILKEFTPRIAPLTLVADSDELLLEETLLESIRERGFEILPFDDSVAFRFAYESRFRSRWDRSESADLVVVVPAERHQLATLPYDLLRAGRQLSFGLDELFPGLSYPVVAFARPRPSRHSLACMDAARGGPTRRRRDEGLRVAARLRRCARARQAAG